MGSLLSEARLALRGLRRNPVFSSVAILTLALGIGANTAIFGVMDAVLLKPLPYPNAERLVWLQNRYHPSGSTGAISAPEFWELRQTDAGLEGVVALRTTAANLNGLEAPLRVEGAAVSPGYFQLLGSGPSMGRGFLAEEEDPDAAGVVIISHGLWSRAFGRDPEVLGREVQLNGRARTVVGVTGPTHQSLVGYLFTGQRVDFWIPAALDPTTFDASSVEVHNLRVLGRLASDASPQLAEVGLLAAVARIETLYPGLSNAGERDFGVVPLRDQVVHGARQILLVLLAAVGLVLLVACLNVTNLLLARGETRVGEISVRAALGAGRGDIVLHVLMESMMIGVIGGALGILLTIWGQGRILAMAPPGLPRLNEVGLNGTVLVFSLALSVLAGLLAGLAPAATLLRGDLLATIKSGGRGGTASRSRQWFRRALVVGQVAAAVVIVTAAGLLGRSLLELRSVDPGFDASNLLMVQVNAPRSQYSDLESVRRLYEDILSRVDALPSVSASSASWQTPFQGGMSDWPVMNQEESADWQSADPNWVSTSYFATHRIALLQGRLFVESDLDSPEGTVVLSQSAARRLWPDQEAVGKRVNIDFQGPTWREVVGVVADVKARGLNSGEVLQTYFPFVDVPFGPIPTLTLTVRTRSDPEPMRRELMDILAAIDPGIPMGPVQSMSQQLERSMSRDRFLSLLVSSFAVVALILGAIGVYGLLAHTVSRRRREIGLRIALGAEPAGVLRGVVLQALLLGSVGLIVGLIASLATARVLESFLFGVTGFDMATLGAVSFVVLGTTVAASYFPARWAASVDPVTALRQD